MITLYGVAISNYYNKVKLSLLEKEIPFTEELVPPSQDSSLTEKSPLGKIPFIGTGDGFLSESFAIVEYLEETFPRNPLFPTDPFARAKLRELILHLELNVELTARRLYGEAFFGGTTSEETKREVRDKLELALNGFSRIAKFAPFILGDSFSAADCAAWVHFGVVGRATEQIYGQNLVLSQIPRAGEYLALLGQRPTVRKLASEQQAAMEAFLQRRRAS